LYICASFIESVIVIVLQRLQFVLNQIINHQNHFNLDTTEVTGVEQNNQPPAQQTSPPATQQTAPPPITPNETPPTVKRSKSKNLPTSDPELHSVMRSCSVYMRNKEKKFDWIEDEEIDQTTDGFRVAIDAGVGHRGNRSPVASAILSLNSEMDEVIEDVKSYLAYKYTKRKAPVYYTECGIVKNNKSYKLPINQEARLLALDTLLKGIVKHSIPDENCGLTYWTEVRNKYSELVASSKSSTSGISVTADEKRRLRETVRKFINCCIYMVRANNPDGYKAELRAMGLLKERY